MAIVDARAGRRAPGLVLDVRDLTTEFRTRGGVVHAVNGVSFGVRQAQIVGLVGESGCGKTATVRSVLGLVRPPGRVVGGQALLQGRDLVGMRRRGLRRVRGSEVGFVAQNPFGALNPILPIARQFHNVVAAHGNGSRKESLERSRAMLEAVGIPDPAAVLEGYAHQLSGGMAQRVVLALALILDPRLVIADEPTTALDVTIQRQILDLMRSVVAEHGRSMLLVTHDLGVVAQYCDDVVVMYAGKVVETGPVKEVFGQPAHPYTRALLEAVPRPGQRLAGLPGRVPNLVDYPHGCPYEDRCGFVMGRCATDAPVPEPVKSSNRRLASCHRPAEEVWADAAPAG